MMKLKLFRKLNLITKGTYASGNTLPGAQGANQYPSDPAAQAQGAANAIQSFTTQGPVKAGNRRIIDYRHPDYNAMINSCEIFRDAWKGGQEFTDKYMQTFSKREDMLDLVARKKYSYCPAISKGAVITIKNAISHRMSEVTRKNGTSTYKTACVGDKWGVDKLGSSMNTFISKEVIPEMLALGRVGVYIDRPGLPDNFTQMDAMDKRPYLYTFKREDILAWVHDDSHEPNQFKVVLLREHFLETDPVSELPIKWVDRYRLLKMIRVDDKNSHVDVTFYDATGKQIDRDGNASNEVYKINIPIIPFVIFEMSESLLTDVAAYQISLLNMASSDVSYALRSNFPFYVEQYDPRSEPGPYKTGITPENKLNKDTPVVNQVRKSIKDDAAKEEIQVGTSSGRRFPIGTIAPSFIAPPTDPLIASMSKQTQLKEEIQQILNFWLSNVTAGSVALKDQDSKQGLESGLNNIGMELEHGENRLAQVWAMFEGEKNNPLVKYPTEYSIKSDSDRLDEAEKLAERRSDIPSTSFQKEVSKMEVRALFRGKLTSDEIAKMEKEIDEAQTMTCNVDDIASDLENGLVGQDLASQARGYPKGEVEIAKKDHAERIARVQMAQQAEGALKNPGSRGVPDKGTAPALDSKLEKKDSATDAGGTPDSSAQRGKGKG